MNETHRSCGPGPGGQGGRRLPRTPSEPPGSLARFFRCCALFGLVLGWLAGCVTPSVQMSPTALLAAHPNPSADGAYTISWAPIGAASKYRLHENGLLLYEGPNLARAVTDRAEGTYVYALTYCVVAFGIEACNFQGAETTVTVTRR